MLFWLTIGLRLNVALLCKGILTKWFFRLLGLVPIGEAIMAQNLKLQLPSDLYAEIESYSKAEGLSIEGFILWSVSEKVGEIRERRQVKNLKYLKPVLPDLPVQKAVSEERTPAPSSSITLQAKTETGAPMARDPKRLLTAREAAKILVISASKMYYMIQTREIPSVRFGRSVRIQEKDLDEFIARQREQN
jgi:excisionase family DNA binding protein